jgi:two-component system OmpR family response regulator
MGVSVGPLRILLVEDEALIAMMLAEALEEAGHAVVVAHTVAEAHAAWAAAHGLGGGRGFDVLVADVGLPDGDGRGLARELRARRPGLAVVLATGYGADANVAQDLGGPPSATAVLAKPFDPSELVNVVARVSARTVAATADAVPIGSVGR